MVVVLEVVDVDVEVEVDVDGDVVVEVFDAGRPVVGVVARPAVGLPAGAVAVGWPLGGAVVARVVELSSWTVGAVAAVWVACASCTEGAGGSISPRLGSPKVGRWTGPTRGSLARPRPTSPR